MTQQALLDHPLIEQRYFFPRTDPVPQPFWIECNGAKLACVYHEVSVEAKTVIHFHGNGEVAADYLDGFPQLIGQMGYNCLLAEYRGYGNSSGRPQLGRMLQDIPEIIHAAGCPPKKLVLFGRSVGSLFALKAAGLYPEVAGLILESAIADLLERLLLRVNPGELGATLQELEQAVSEQLDIQDILKNFSKPTLILHARHDGLVDVSHAERLADWCNGPVSLQIFPQGDHNDIMFVNGPQYFGLVKSFLERLP